jgi:hypothetical protein
MRSGLGRLAPITLILAFLSVGRGLASDKAYNPHEFMSEKEKCGTCHSGEPVTASTPLVKDAVSICWECHFEKMQEVHPVDIRPENAESIRLPLDVERTITCVTCHDPHSDPYAEIPYTRQNPIERLTGIFKGYRTYFLRIPNDEGQICLNCHTRRDLTGTGAGMHDDAARDFRGSASCRPCHEDHYGAWSMSYHARTLKDPSVDPAAVAAVFTGRETFSRQEIYRSLGTHWTQRYLIERDEGVRVSKEVWSLFDKEWSKPYWREQMWRELCAGCHYTGYNPYVETFVEEGVGCESCHGPGGSHVDSRLPEHILNPAKLDANGRDTICASCHTHGHDRTGEFRYPVGYAAGQDLTLYFKGLIPKKGQDKETFKDDGSLADRLRSFRYWVNRFLARKGVNCTLCKSFRSGGETAPETTNEPDEMSLAEHCFSCHSLIEEGSSVHAAELTAETDCYGCHEPMRDAGGDPSIHDHKFVFKQALERAVH